MKEFKINWKEKVGSSFNVDFINRHRMSPKDFTRHRNLSFAKLMTYLLKSAKKKSSN